MSTVRRIQWLVSIALVLAGVANASEEGHGEASARRRIIQLYQGVDNEYAVLALFRRTLKADGKQGRMYYEAVCQPDNEYPLAFPRTHATAFSTGKTDLSAVREIFRNQKDVTVTETPPGIVRLRIGRPPEALLQTRISRITLSPIAQYNWFMAFGAIENTKEVKSAMRRLKIDVPRLPVNMLTIEPAPGLPHLPTSIANVTMDQALDVIARTFRGIVVYGACAQSTRLYNLALYGGVYSILPRLRGSA